MTCTTNGLTEGKHCAACNVVLVAQTEVAPLGHLAGEKTVITKPTDVLPGLSRVSCTVCGTTIKEEEIPATGVAHIAGDADGDGEVGIYDALAILQYAVGWDVGIKMDFADVNADGEVDIYDALLILQYAVGWDVELK